MNTTTVTVGTVTFDDAYTWLEHDSERTSDWQRQQNERTDGVLRGLPGFAAILDGVEAADTGRGHHDESVGAVPTGGRSFLIRHLDGAQVASLWVQERDASEPRLVIDPAVRGRHFALATVSPSPTGRYVAYTFAEEGNTRGATIRVLDVDTGQDIAPDVPLAAHTDIAWLPDESGLYCTAAPSADVVDSVKRILFWRPGAAEAVAQELGADLTVHVLLQVSSDGRFVGALEMIDVAHRRMRWILDRAEPDRGWREFLPAGDGACSGAFVADTYVAVVTGGTDRGRIVAIPVTTSGDESTWAELRSESGLTLSDLSRAGDWLVLQAYERGASVVEILRLDGRVHARVPLPTGSVVWPGALRAMALSDEVTMTPVNVRFDGGIWRYSIGEGRLTRLRPPAAQLDDAVVTEVVATSADGTQVHCHLLALKKFGGEGPRPIVINGYGGFGAPPLLRYAGWWRPFLEAGGMLAWAHLRGDGAFGRDWREQGRYLAKQNTYHDLYAIAEELIARELTTPDRLGFTGLSNGGLTAAVAIVQRPDLFRAVVPEVPITDLMRGVNDPYAEFAMSIEYGDPRNPRFSDYLYAYSPVHNLVDGTAYPAVLIISGDRDANTPAWHGRKFAARLQEATTSPHPVLLRVWEHTGHGAGERDIRRQYRAEIVAFFMEHLTGPRRERRS
ncbi:prolyl oligopeptidase family serine peptidase [Nonomuraea sp. NPDC050394]|uniref:prolyl oligopeptidase family serine peptidase n=1 Tax=Nonomuraea sp. NPDC050394 TaxID=3364363 RepID=UPI00379539A3